MSRRWILAAVAVLALLLTACSPDRVTITTPSAKAPTDATAPKAVDDPSQQAEPQEQLDPDSCVEVTKANLDLAVSSTADAAQAAADVFARFDPPADVAEAIDHFVETGGVQYDDPDFDEYNARIDDWIKEVCPL